MKEMTHKIILIHRAIFGNKGWKESVNCRLLKTSIVLSNGNKYKKSDGLMVGGHRYMGTYMESTTVDLDSLSELS